MFDVMLFTLSSLILEDNKYQINGYGV